MMISSSPFTAKAMSALAQWIFSVLIVIAPPEKLAPAVQGETVEQMTARYRTTAIDMAAVIDDRGPLFKGSDGAFKTAATMVSIMKFESELANDVAVGKRRGDRGKSWCYMQIMIDGKRNIWGDDEMKSWTGQDLVDDWRKCFSVAHEILRYSLRSCSRLQNGDILSGYTAGVCMSNEKKARHRWNYAQWVLRKFPVPAPEASDLPPPAQLTTL